MLKRVPSYQEVRQMAASAYADGIGEGFTNLQAFAYTYEHLDLLIEGEDPWLKLLTITAVFSIAAENCVRLERDSLFTQDVIQMLRSSYCDEASHDYEKAATVAEKTALKADMKLVQEAYLCKGDSRNV